METNCSWSIDDSRNKFQFGCERGRLIENGKLGARRQESQLPRHLARTSGAASRASATPTRCRCWARRIAARASRRRSSASATRRPRACSRDVDVFGGEHDARVRRRRTGDDGAYFHDVAATLDGLARGRRDATPRRFAAEASDFVRMNRGKVRQPGNVAQRYLDVDLIRGARHASHRAVADRRPRGRPRRGSRAAVAGLRAALPELADDPHLLHRRPTSRRRAPCARRTAAAGGSRDRRGARRRARRSTSSASTPAGPVWRGFANSFGQRNWHEATTFNLQWSLYHRADKAVKTALRRASPGTAARSPRKMDEARERLALIARPREDARARASTARILAPSAMEEIAALLCWGGFSARALATQAERARRACRAATARARPARDDRRGTADGVAPAFQGEGFARPGARAADRRRAARRLAGRRRAPRASSALAGERRQRRRDARGAGDGGRRRSPRRDALAALGTGLYVGNLHYLNYSDRPACRMTGMTRFATFWVEGGKIVAPVDVLRFDDTRLPDARRRTSRR